MKNKIFGIGLACLFPAIFINMGFFQVGAHMDAYTFGPDIIYGITIFSIVVAAGAWLGALLYSGRFDE